MGFAPLIMHKRTSYAFLVRLALLVQPVMTFLSMFSASLDPAFPSFNSFCVRLICQRVEGTSEETTWTKLWCTRTVGCMYIRGLHQWMSVRWFLNPVISLVGGSSRPTQWCNKWTYSPRSCSSARFQCSSWWTNSTCYGRFVADRGRYYFQGMAIIYNVFLPH